MQLVDRWTSGLYIKASTIVIYDVGVVNYATNSGVTIFDPRVVNTMLASYFFS